MSGPGARRGEVAAALGLGLVAAGTRLAVARLPGLAEPNYEEALVGLMARHLLQGDFVTFWWGHPYLGALDVYGVAALFGFLGASTFVLRLGPLLFSLGGTACSYLFARALFGRRWALLCLAWWAVPPAFLLRLNVTPYEYTAGVALGAAIYAVTSRAVAHGRVRDPRWLLVGGLWGLALWDHLVALSFVGASALAIVLGFVAAGRAAGGGAAAGFAAGIPAYARCAAGFVAGSAPFWLWNLPRGFETLTEVAAPAVAAPAGLGERLGHLVLTLLPELLGRAEFFWGELRAGPLWSLAAAALSLPVGLAAVGALAGLGRSLGRPAARGAGPAALGLGMAGAGFVLSCAQVVLSRYHFGRYLMPVYPAVPVLWVAATRWLAGRARIPAVALAGGVLVLHAADGARLAGAHLVPPAHGGGVAEVLGVLAEAGVRHVYAHFRVGWPIAFVSGESVVAADFHAAKGFLAGKTSRGRRSGVYLDPYFRAIDEVDLAPRVALVTHERLRQPSAAELASALALLDGRYRRRAVGPYTVFDDFEPPRLALREVPAAALAVRASRAPAAAPAMLDGDISTAWSSESPQEPGMWVEVRLDRPRRLVKIRLHPGSRVDGYPRGLRVETSPDGRTWTRVVEARGLLGGIDWLNGHPKLDRQGIVGVWIPPTEARAVRLTQLAPARGRAPWAIAELALFEAGAEGIPASAPWDPGPDGPALLGALRAHRARAVYAFDEANVFFTRHRPAGCRTVTLRDTRPVEQHERVVRFDRRQAFFLRARSESLERQLAARGVAVERRAFPSGVLYLTDARAGARPAYWDGDRLLAVAVPE